MVEFLCDRTGVMYHGKLVEEGKTKDIFAHPEHEYTKALLAAVPIPDPRIERQKGEALCFQTCTGRSTVFLLRRTSGKDES